MKKNLLTGLVLLLPLAVTVAVVVFIVRFLTKPFVGIVSSFLKQYDLLGKGFLFLSSQQTVELLAQLIILIGIFLFVLLLGFLARMYFINWMFKQFDKILHRLPLINKIYKTTQEIITNIFGEKKDTFRQVVLVPFPGRGIYTLGLMSQPAPKDLSQSVGANLISVLIPTTPNPTTGYLILYNEEDLIFVDMKPEDAIKYIVSCGVLAPVDDHEDKLVATT